MSESGDEKGVGRRQLGMAAGAGACVLGAGLVAPAVITLAAPIAAGPSASAGYVAATRLDALKEGAPQKVVLRGELRDAWTVSKDVELGAVWLVRQGDKVLALAAACPHLGCAIASQDKGFGCPCHTSSFDAAGKRLSGPSPRDMDELGTRIEGGIVMVGFARFRTGDEKKVAL
jgi:menaquinol-cytochrome c reductase iron-sulfur subunit